MSINDFEAELKRRLKGYHVDIKLYPAGGLIDATGCEECGTDDSFMESAMWRIHRGGTMESAVLDLESKIAAKGSKE